MLIRLLAAAVAVTAALGIGASAPEAAADPGPCGFVSVTKDSTTTMVTIVDYCPTHNCNGEQGFGYGQPPIGAGGVEVGAWACVGLP